MPVFQNRPPKTQVPPLSFGIEKAIIDTLSQAETVTDDLLVQEVSHAFKLAHDDKLINSLLPKLVEGVIQRINTLQEEKGKPSSNRPANKSLGTNYASWLSDLNAEQVCLYLADYNPIKAEQYYWFADLLTIQEAVKLKSQHDNQMALIQMEAALYGAGGKYQEDTGGDGGSHYDMDSAEGSSALKSLGF